MSLPVYFVQPPGLPLPPGPKALCAWHTGPEGALEGPEEAEYADALVFDDRHTLPSQFDHLIAALAQKLAELRGSTLILDFERSPAPESLAFVKALSKQCPVAAPAPYCSGTSASPIFCYCPRRETFEEFSQRIPQADAWLELRPIDEWILYPLCGQAPTQPGTSFFSDLLQCHYSPEITLEGLQLHLYDTPQSLLGRAEALLPQLRAAIGLHCELEDYHDLLYHAVPKFR